MVIVLVDANVVLDVFLDRAPFAGAATELWQKIERHELVGLACSFSFNIVYYVARKQKGRDVAREAVRAMLGVFGVAAVDRAVLEAADASTMSGYEDAVQLQSAIASGCTHLVTRDVGDFDGAPIQVLTPEQCLALLAARG